MPHRQVPARTLQLIIAHVLLVTGYAVQVKLTPAAAGVSFQPHPQHDSCEFDSLGALGHRLDTQGYYGGIRLLMVSYEAAVFLFYCPAASALHLLQCSAIAPAARQQQQHVSYVCQHKLKPLPCLFYFLIAGASFIVRSLHNSPCV